MENEMVIVEQKDRVGTVILNRPDKRNALHPRLVSGLKEAIGEFTKDPSVKIILLRGNGNAFCAGADLSVIKALRDATYEENLDDSRHLAEMFDCIYKCPKPVIAAVHGHAIAGGCGLAAVCDIVIASENAKFGYTETRIGFVPAIVGQFLIRKTGETHARHLLLTGSLISAAEAARIGLVTRCVPDEDFNAEVDALIDTLLFKTSGEALQSTKNLLNAVSDMTHEEAITHAIEANAKARSTSDCQKGIEAFLNKEKLKW